MKNSTKDMLSDWMRPIEVSGNTEANGHRDKAIKKICASKDKALWLNILRTALGLPSNLKEGDFIQNFKKLDDNVPLDNNEHLVKILANITICYKLESGDSELNHLLSLAIVNSQLIGQLNPESHIPILAYAQENLEAGAISNRNIDMEKLHENVSELKEEAEEGEKTSIKQIILDLYSVNLRLLEETNILWWLYTGYSKIANSPVEKIDPKVAPLYAALELKSLMHVPRVISNAMQFFNKILGERSQNKTSVYAAVNSLNEETKKTVIGLFASDPNEFSPVAKALTHAIGYPEGDDWSGAFKKQFHCDVKKEITNISLGDQFYRELLYLSLCGE